ncbi:LruC domain-containing protein [Flammeovirga aprica]|uniref:LruC domain-containing protein n=1 Tax=Flammeovirga aprica JL-4 TaxID=694437 RepID=A0A7X9RUA9_9BACT|nr:LruC domain-containing protein [Flammeovirga aprica]NME68839.1 LruC domain-containing protein [Flammeovirga aprica JL-4]
MRISNLYVLTLVFIFGACTVVKDDSNTNPTPVPTTNSTFEDVKAPASFDYATVKELSVKVQSKFNPIQSVLTFYIVDNNGEYFQIGRALSDLTGNLEHTLTVPSFVERLYVTKIAKGVEWYEITPLSNDQTTITFDRLSQKSFAGTSSNARTSTACEDIFFAVNGNGESFAINFESGYTVTDYGDLVGKSFANGYDQENDIIYYDNTGDLYSYVRSTGTSTFVASLNTASSNFHNGYPRMAYEKGRLFIADNQHMAVVDPTDGTVLKNLVISGIPTDKHGAGDLAFSSTGALYQACRGGLYQLTFNSDSTAVSASRISADDFPYSITGVTFDRFDNLYLSTNSSNSVIIQMDINDGSYSIVQNLSRKVNDLCTFRCSEDDFGGADADGDGVVDGFDEYPNDPERAFNNYNPGKNGFGTYAFEDLYPEKGDYDFNDIMVHYRHNYVSNAGNKVVEVLSTYEVSTVESSLPSGFGIELPIHSDSVSSVSGSNILSGVTSLNDKGLESGIDDAKPCVIIFDNHFGLVQGVGAIRTSDELDMTISFTNPIPFGDLPVANFNPFIFVNQDRSREVHMANGTPTQKFNSSLRTSGADAGNYKTSAGHPWALHMPHKFHPPHENIDITNAYLNFRTFVESGGTSNADWYTDDAGNRESGLIHLQD